VSNPASPTKIQEKRFETRLTNPALRSFPAAPREFGDRRSREGLGRPCSPPRAGGVIGCVFLSCNVDRTPERSTSGVLSQASLD
jgi:hypothetical protein